jgi:hypothetical protein
MNQWYARPRPSCAQLLVLVGLTFGVRSVRAEPPTKDTPEVAPCDEALRGDEERSAATQTVVLDYQTDAALGQCPDAAAFREMVREQLGYDPFRATAQRRVVVRAKAQGDSFVRWVEVNTGTVQGERSLAAEPQGCGALVRTLSFAVAVQIDFARADPAEKDGEKQPIPCAVTAPETATPEPAAPEPAATEQPSPGSPADPPPAALRPARAPAAMRPAAQAAGDWRGSAGLGPALLLRSSPPVGLDGRVFAAIARGNVSVEVALGATLPQRLETSPNEGFQHSMVWGSLAGCGVLRPVMGCALGRVVRLAVRGFGVDEPRSASGWFVELGPRVALFAEFSRRWLAALRVEALLVLNPARVTLNEQRVWRTPGWSLGIGADVGVIWGDNP